MSKLSLKQAAEFAGVTKPTVLKHIKAGRVSAQKDTEGRWWFDVAELVRVYGEPEARNDFGTVSGNISVTSWNHPSFQQETAVQQLLVELRRQLEEQKAERERERDDLRRLLEREQDRHERERSELITLLREKEATIKLLTSPPSPIHPTRRHWWTRLFGH